MSSHEIPERPIPAPDESFFDNINKAVRADGNILELLGCDRARQEWFTIAQQEYIDVAGKTTDDWARVAWPYKARALAVGSHVAVCPAPECELLADTWWGYLRSSELLPQERLIDIVEELKQRVKTG